MKKVWIFAVALVVATFCGCSAWMNGYYASVTPHKEQNFLPEQELMNPRNYKDVVEILEDMVKSGQKKKRISIEKIEDDWQKYMLDAAGYVCDVLPVGVYAVSKIDYSLDTSGEKDILSVDISYRRSIADIDAVRTARTDKQIEEILYDSLLGFNVSVAISISDYEDVDFEKIIRNYAELYPQYVIEIPRVSTIMYPADGKDRIVELLFNYETGRTQLLQMKEQIRPIFEASEVVGGEGPELGQFTRLYSFLMNYHEYTIAPSITPAYSLLHNGVGDSRAFASVYAAMCRQAGLECGMITGIRDGKVWYWNVLQIEGETYYVDLLRCQESGDFVCKTASEMTGYVWDNSGY